MQDSSFVLLGLAAQFWGCVGRVELSQHVVISHYAVVAVIGVIGAFFDACKP
jgi:hypothetical protein